jgi:hypothetical protein
MLFWSGWFGGFLRSAALSRHFISHNSNFPSGENSTEFSAKANLGGGTNCAAWHPTTSMTTCQPGLTRWRHK